MSSPKSADQRQGKKAPKPKRKAHLTGIKAHLAADGWKWRACAKRMGKQTVGPLRETQEQAHADYLELRGSLDQIHSPELGIEYLGPGIEALLKQKRAEGMAKNSYLTLEYHTRLLLSAWKPGVLLASIEKQHLEAFSKTLLGQGYVGSTVGSVLQALKQVFVRADVAYPRDFRPPKSPAPLIEFFEPDELVDIVHRIETWKGQMVDGRRLNLPAQVRDAAIVKLFGCTGIRGGEFNRLRAKDINVKRRAITVCNRKNAGQVEQIIYGESLDGAIQTILSCALEDGRLIASKHALDAVWARWKRRLGVKINGRMLRHTEATRVLVDTGDLGAVMDRLRHAKITTTARYLHATQQGVRRSLEAQDERWRQHDPGTESESPSGERPACDSE